MQNKKIDMITPYYGDVIDKAQRLALAEHMKHKHGQLPYSYHLTAVAGLVSCFTTNPDVIAAAWLHDIIEDCDAIDKEVVAFMTNDRVAEIVDLLTDPPGPRELVKQISLPRIAKDADATLVKLCDRYHNIASTIMDGSEKHAAIYLAEFDTFLDTLLSGGNANLRLVQMIKGQWYELAHVTHAAVR